VQSHWNVRISVEEMPKSVNERSWRVATIQAQMIGGSRIDRAGGSLSDDYPAQDSTLVP